MVMNESHEYRPRDIPSLSYVLIKAHVSLNTPHLLPFIPPTQHPAHLLSIAPMPGREHYPEKEAKPAAQSPGKSQLFLPF